MAKEYFCAYHSYLKSIRNLSDAECGRLFKALLQYSAGGELINLQGREGIAFDFICEQIDRDNEKYQAKCEKNRENGAKSTEANAPERYRTPPNGTERHRTPPKEKEKEKDIIPPISPQVDRFAVFWDSYPKKQGKGAAEKAWDKIKPDKKTFDRILSAVSEQKHSAQWRKDNGQYIPNPATWLNQRRWEDEITGSASETSFDVELAMRMMKENGEKQ